MRLTLRERIFGRAEDRTLDAQSIPPVMLSSLPAGSVTPSNATEIGDAYACIRVLADAAASVPLIAYRRTQDGRQRIESGRTVELLERPAPAMTQAALVGQMVAHLNTHGNAYLGKFRTGGEITQLALLAPDRVQPEIKAGRPLYTLTGPMGEQSVHGPEDITHIKALTTDGLVGLSPVRQARVVLGLSDQLARHGLSFFANAARPSGVLRVNKFGAQADDPDIVAIEDGFNAKHTGTDNAHKIAVVTGEVDFTAVSMPLDDAQFLQQRKLSAVEVARIFRVPPHLIGADTGESMTYSNLETASIEFVTYSLRPWLVAIEQALSADPDLFATRTYCEFLLDALLRADSKTRAEVYRMALDPITGWMNRAEVRQRENLEPEEPLAPTSPAVAEVLAATNGNGTGNPENVAVG